MAGRDPNEFLETFGALSRTLRASAAREYAAHEVGSAQAKFLRHIGRHSRISQAELARATVTDPALTGRVLQALIDRGWVRRKRSEEDRRQYLLELSAAGQRMREQLEKLRLKVARRVMAALEERDVTDFERVAKKILSAFE